MYILQYLKPTIAKILVFVFFFSFVHFIEVVTIPPGEIDEEFFGRHRVTLFLYVLNSTMQVERLDYARLLTGFLISYLLACIIIYFINVNTWKRIWKKSN